MPRRVLPASLKNLKPQKKGEPAPAGVGRPKGSRDRLNIVEELLGLRLKPKAAKEAQESLSITLKVGTLTTREVMWAKVLERALTGDLAAIDRLEDVMRPLKKHLLLGEDPENPLPQAISDEDVVRIIQEAAEELKPKAKPAASAAKTPARPAAASK